MELPVVPPFAPMLARLARELPQDPGLSYEPKWDGFRCVVFRDGRQIDLRSRNQRPLARYFPELVEAFRGLPVQRFVVDGEIVVVAEDRFDFGALMARLHPAASRVELLRRETPATFVAFDLIARGDDDLRSVPFSQRRTELERLVSSADPHVVVTPATADPKVALAWLDSYGGGIDGVVVKPAGLLYQPGRRAMTKVKRERTADCVVAGFRVFANEPLVASLLLGVHDRAGEFRHVGVAASFTESRRRELFDELQRFVVPLGGHVWESGFGLGRSPVGRLAGAAGRWTPELEQDWVPVRPTLVCEVAYEHWDGDRFRHPARWRRWRPDRDAASCTLEQFEVATPAGFPGAGAARGTPV